MVDDPIDDGEVGEESDDLHRAPALRTDERIVSALLWLRTKGLSGMCDMQKD